MRWWERLRPLDPVRSIKAKFALLIAANLGFTAVVTYYAVVVLHWRVRYGMIGASLLALGLSQVLAHGMTRRLRQMTAAVRELGAGRPIPPISTSSRDEVGELARAFTVMAQELTAVDRQRRQLLADVGHELRTPVAALRAQIENLADGVTPADPPRLTEVLAQVERLGDLLTDLLRLAEADGGPLVLDHRPVVLSALVDPVVAEIAVARPGPAIEVRIEPPGLVAQVDPLRLRQVLTNLLDNAARHAGDGGKVWVRAEELPPGGLLLEVTDDGPGIPPDRWSSVFERFRSGGDPGGEPAEDESRLQGGTGLGLAIARWAVVLHGGTIAVVPAETGGCRIRVEIPGGIPGV
jgi:signal transduction histidine kinase